MKKLLPGILLIIFSLTLLAKVELKFTQTVVDFGEIESGSIQNLNFQFVNAGDKQLIIRDVSTSCGCAVPQLEKKEFAAGEKGQLPVTFNSRGYNGRVVKYITVTSNDEANPTIQLKIQGNVVVKNFADAVVEPSDIDFLGAIVGKKYTKKVTIKNTGTIELSIIEVTHSPDVMVEFFDKEVKPKGSSEIQVTYKPLQPGRATKWIRVRTNAYNNRDVLIKMNTEVAE